MVSKYCGIALPLEETLYGRASLQSLRVRSLEACFSFFGDGMVAGMSDYWHKRHNVSALISHMVCPATSRRVIFDAESDLRRKALQYAQSMQKKARGFLGMVSSLADMPI